MPAGESVAIPGIITRDRRAASLVERRFFAWRPGTGAGPGGGPVVISPLRRCAGVRVDQHHIRSPMLAHPRLAVRNAPPHRRSAGNPAGRAASAHAPLPSVTSPGVRGGQGPEDRSRLALGSRSFAAPIIPSSAPGPLLVRISSPAPALVLVGPGAVGGTLARAACDHASETASARAREGPRRPQSSSPRPRKGRPLRPRRTSPAAAARTERVGGMSPAAKAAKSAAARRVASTSALRLSSVPTRFMRGH